MTTARSPPERNAFTPTERKLVEELTTPVKVQRFLTAFPYNPDDTARSFRATLERGSGNCIEGALVAATILEQHGYPPLLLDIESQDGIGHVLFLYRENGKFGTVGLSKFPGLHGRKPVYVNLHQLALTYHEPYIDATGRVTGYALYDLRDLPAKVDWRFLNGNVWDLVDHLIAMPHHAIETSDARYRVLRDRYLKFKKKHPKREPRYFRTVPNWLE